MVGGGFAAGSGTSPGPQAALHARLSVAGAGCPDIRVGCAPGSLLREHREAGKESQIGRRLGDQQFARKNDRVADDPGRTQVQADGNPRTD